MTDTFDRKQHLFVVNWFNENPAPMQIFPLKSCYFPDEVIEDLEKEDSELYGEEEFLCDY